MKKITLLLSLIIGGTTLQAQTGLDSVIVEKYYVTNAADANGADAAGMGPLPVGSVTYRVYASMKPGYILQGLFSTPADPNASIPVLEQIFKVTTTTTFYNHTDFGQLLGNQISSTKLKNNAVALDSYFSFGGAANGQLGVLKSEDNGAVNLLPIVADPMLKNNLASIGIPLNVNDGIIAGTTYAVSASPGLDVIVDSIFGTINQNSGTFLINDGSGLYNAPGAPGSGAYNRVLIGQFTTDGIFGFELNLQLRSSTGFVERFVARNPNASNEVVHPSLIFVTNVPPTVSITSPLSGASVTTGDVVTITASALDTDGTIDSVEFFDGTVSIGIKQASPFEINWTSTTGSHNITAKATDNKGDITTSSIVIINAAIVANIPPTITVTAPATANSGAVVAISATTTDSDGTVAKVEFLVDNVSVGIDSVSPFSIDWTAVTGNHVIKGIATDNLGATTTSATVNTNIVSVGINNLEANVVSFSIFPNPAHELITIDIVNSKSDYNSYSIYDVTGNLMIKKELGAIALKYAEKLDISSYPTGLYFVLVSVDGTVISKKVIKH